MNSITTVGLLLVAAVLEVGGDALVRLGLHRSAASARLLFFALGAAVLFAYSWTVNAPPWDFGRLLGLYVVLFFVTAQVISWLVFHQPPGLTMLVGGTLIVSGGFVIALAR